MITLTKLDGETFTVNAFHTFRIECPHETRVTFINGQTQLVKESKEEVEDKLMDCFKQIFSGILPST